MNCLFIDPIENERKLQKQRESFARNVLKYFGFEKKNTVDIS